MILKVWFLNFLALFDHFVKLQLVRYQKDISQEWSIRVKNISCVSCAAWNGLSINLLSTLRTEKHLRQTDCVILTWWPVSLLYFFRSLMFSWIFKSKSTHCEILAHKKLPFLMAPENKTHFKVGYSKCGLKDFCSPDFWSLDFCSWMFVP